MNEHPSYLVYQHLGRFLQSRGLVPGEGVDLDMARHSFITELSHIGYYRLDARDEATRKIITILVLAIRGKYTDHGPQLRSLVASLNSENFAREGRLTEVIVVAPEDIMKKKNMTDVVKDFREAAANGESSPGTPNAPPPAAEFYNMYPYYVFSLDIPRAQIVPHHELVSPAEVRTFLARERLNLRDLPMVASTNPPVIWIGGRPGQVVRIQHPSETAGEAHHYCVISRS